MRPATKSFLAVVPNRPVRLLALLASLVAALVVLSGKRGPGSLPENELLFGLMSYLVGPGGLSVAAATMLPRHSPWVIPLALAAYGLGLVAYMLFAVNVGAIAH